LTKQASFGGAVITVFDDFGDEEWQATLDELRLLVISSGFGEWDAAMIASLDEEEERFDSRSDVLQYAQRFSQFLKVRTSSNLKRMTDRLGQLLVDDQDEPVRNANLRDGRSPPQPLLFNETSDEFIAEIAAFANAVAGEAGYFDEGSQQE
jgi:hypothetical protein